MAISDMLNRRVRARPDEEEEDFSEESGIEEAPQDEDEEEDDSDNEDNESQDADEGDESSDNEENNADPEDLSGSDSESNDDIQASLSNISFGALAKAQASAGPKKRKEKEPKPSESTPLDDIRARIREVREQKREAADKADTKKSDKKAEKQAARANKHAPMQMSSKHAVTRRRTVVEPPAIAKARDPRFDAAVMGYSGAGRYSEGTSKAYAFLDDYRAAELKELKDQYAKTKNAQQKEELKRQIRSEGDRMKAIENKKRERDIISEHNKREKQLLREGKKSTPYFLKKSDLKKQVLEKKYAGMKSRDRAKAMERRRKKVASKERKDMPMERRGANDDAGPPKRRRLD